MEYRTISSIIGLIIGVTLVVFRRQLLEREKRRLANRKDYISRQFVAYPNSDGIFLYALVGAMLWSGH